MELGELSAEEQLAHNALEAEQDRDLELNMPTNYDDKITLLENIIVKGLQKLLYVEYRINVIHIL